MTVERSSFPEEHIPEFPQPADEPAIFEHPDSGKVPEDPPLPEALQAGTPWQEATATEQMIYDLAYHAGRITGGLIVERAQLRSTNAHLEKKANTDPLTGLDNKTALITKVDTRLRGDEFGPYGMLFIDLRNFKAINDNHARGHQRGDEVLQSVADLLKGKLRSDDDHGDLIARGSRRDTNTVARLGGDEFAVFAKLANRGELRPPEENLAALCNRLLELFNEYLAENPDLQWGFGLTVGAVIRRQNEYASDLLQRADRVMYDEKALQRRDGKSYR